MCNFVPGSSGTVQDVQISMNGGAVTMRAELYSGSTIASGTLIGTSTNTVAPAIGVGTFDFSGVNLTAGQDYLILFRSESALPCTAGGGDMITSFGSSQAVTTPGVTTNGEFEQSINCAAPTYLAASAKIAFTLNYSGGSGNWIDLH